MTERFADQDIWDFTFNSSNPHVEYVHFRDFENQLIYAGWVDGFSEAPTNRELLLRDVIIYDFDSVEQYRLPYVYLARSSENLQIEFPALGEDASD